MPEVIKISSAQMRAARALLRWTALDLANASRVGVATIRRAEVVDGEIPVTLANEAALRRALEDAGKGQTTECLGATGHERPRRCRRVCGGGSRPCSVVLGTMLDKVIVCSTIAS